MTDREAWSDALLDHSAEPVSVAADGATRQPEAPPLIALRNVTKHFLKGRVTVPVLRQLDLAVGQGSFIAFMGSSGSGKTTTLNLIGGLDRPTGGTIEVGGQAINRLTREQLSRWRARWVGFIFQFYNLLPSLTAAQNVEVPLLIQGLPRAERRRRVQRALDLVDLLDRAQHRPGELSGGQQQRVAIARALIADPPILLCDEPTGDLDRDTGLMIMDVLRELNRVHGKTILLATHDGEAAGFADRIVRFDRRAGGGGVA
jgi:putative ABC transport system ATP-binding protein